MNPSEQIAETLRSIRDEAVSLADRAPSPEQRRESRARIDDLAHALEAVQPHLQPENRVWHQRLLSEIAVLKYLLGAQAGEAGGRRDRTASDIQWAAGLVRDVSRLLLRLVSQR